MSDFTDKQLAAIEAAMKAKGFESSAQLVLAELRPKPKFAEGQVVYSRNGLPGGVHYFNWSSSFRPAPNLDMRPLTLTEHGPAVRDLRDALEKQTASRSWNADDYDGMLQEFNRMTKAASIALAAFDKEISDD